MPHRRTRDTEPMDKILLWAVQLQGQWRSISTELSPDRHRGWPSHSSQRSTGCNTIIEEREVSWSRQHPSRTGPSRLRGCNHRSHDNRRQNLADRKMANPMDPVLSHHTSQERQLAAVPELPNDQLHQPPKQSHAEDHTEQIEASSGENHRRRKGGFQSRKAYHRADLQPTHSMWKYLQHHQDFYHVFIDFKKAFDGVWHAALWGTHKEVQHQHKPYPNHQKLL